MFFKLARPFQSTIPSLTTQNPRLIDEEVQCLLNKSAIIQVPFDKHYAFYHPIFLVVKKNGFYRPVLDLIQQNTFIETTHFKIENLATLKSLLNPSDYMINIDLTDAYLSLPIHQDSQRFLRFTWPNKSYQFKAMPFRINVAPRVFTKLLKPVVAWLLGQGIRLII